MVRKGRSWTWVFLVFPLFWSTFGQCQEIGQGYSTSFQAQENPKEKQFLQRFCRWHNPSGPIFLYRSVRVDPSKTDSLSDCFNVNSFNLLSRHERLERIQELNGKEYRNVSFMDFSIPRGPALILEQMLQGWKPGRKAKLTLSATEDLHQSFSYCTPKDRLTRYRSLRLKPQGKIMTFIDSLNPDENMIGILLLYQPDETRDPILFFKSKSLDFSKGELVYRRQFEVGLLDIPAFPERIRFFFPLIGPTKEEIRFFEILSWDKFRKCAIPLLEIAREKKADDIFDVFRVVEPVIPELLQNGILREDPLMTAIRKVDGLGVELEDLLFDPSHNPLGKFKSLEWGSNEETRAKMLLLSFIRIRQQVSTLDVEKSDSRLRHCLSLLQIRVQKAIQVFGTILQASSGVPGKAPLPPKLVETIRRLVPIAEEVQTFLRTRDIGFQQ